MLTHKDGVHSGFLYKGTSEELFGGPPDGITRGATISDHLRNEQVVQKRDAADPLRMLRIVPLPFRATGEGGMARGDGLSLNNTGQDAGASLNLSFWEAFSTQVLRSCGSGSWRLRQDMPGSARSMATRVAPRTHKRMLPGSEPAESNI